MEKGTQRLDQFYLKLIAILAMTLDHIGVFLCYYYPRSFSSAGYVVGYIFRAIGRIAMPLFLLFLVDGIRNTSHAGKYLGRIFIVMTLVMGFSIFTYYNYSTMIEVASSPFVDLFLIGLTLYLLKRKDIYSILAIIPIGYIVFVTGIQFFESINDTTCYFLPFYIRPAYSLFGLLLGLGFYYSYGLTNKYLKKTTDLDDEAIESVKGTPYYRSIVTIIMISVLILLNFIIFLLGYITINDEPKLDIYSHYIENFSLLTIPFLLLYTGKRGYNKSWFKYACYFYFPVHIILIFLIFFISFN